MAPVSLAGNGRVVVECRVFGHRVVPSIEKRVGITTMSYRETGKADGV